MKKFLTVASLALLTVLLALTLAGCGGVGKLQKAYEKEGYTCEVKKASDEDIKEIEDYIAELPDGEEKDAAKKELEITKKAEILNISKQNVPVAKVIYVPNIDDYKEILGETAWGAAEGAGYIKGNLVFTPIADLSGDAFKIFKDNA